MPTISFVSEYADAVAAAFAARKAKVEVKKSNRGRTGKYNADEKTEMDKGMLVAYTARDFRYAGMPVSPRHRMVRWIVPEPDEHNEPNKHNEPSQSNQSTGPDQSCDARFERRVYSKPERDASFPESLDSGLDFDRVLDELPLDCDIPLDSDTPPGWHTCAASYFDSSPVWSINSSPEDLGLESLSSLDSRTSPETDADARAGGCAGADIANEYGMHGFDTAGFELPQAGAYEFGRMQAAGVSVAPDLLTLAPTEGFLPSAEGMAAPGPQGEPTFTGFLMADWDPMLVESPITEPIAGGDVSLLLTHLGRSLHDYLTE